jgi:hypothetical protein
MLSKPTWLFGYTVGEGVLTVAIVGGGEMQNQLSDRETSRRGDGGGSIVVVIVVLDVDVVGGGGRCMYILGCPFFRVERWLCKGKGASTST